MTRLFARGRIAAALAAAAPVAILASASPAAAIPVFDPTNYAQNVLQAARALEQINNQVRSLQNEASMLQSMAKNLQRIDFPELSRMTSGLKRIDQLMGEAKAIGATASQLEALFPGASGQALRSDARVAAAKARLDAAMASYRQSMGVQAQVAANVGEDAGLLEQLIGRSQSAEGALQASQATNQLLALGAKQQLQLQSLMAAGLREASLERARVAQAEAEGRAASRRFLSSGHPYTPQ